MPPPAARTTPAPRPAAAHRPAAADRPARAARRRRPRHRRQPAPGGRSSTIASPPRTGTPAARTAKDDEADA
ncbi:MAG: hypothetical protein D8H96_12535 [Lautropia sp.]|nr:MAG: hypothetical protein D8H96_12535 [Lautropia sp.]